jgi:hypothetical protein
MRDYLMLWRAEEPIDSEAAFDLYRRLLHESTWPPPKAEGAVGDLIQKLDQVFPLTDPENSPWKDTPHCCGDSYVILQVLASRLPEVMNVAIPLAQQAGMTVFVPSTKQMYFPTDAYTPEPLLPSLDAMLGELTGAADLSEAIQVALGQGLEAIGFKRVDPEAYIRETKSCTHLVNAILREHLDGTVGLRVHVGIRFEAAERIRAAADRPEMNWELKKTHPTVGFSLEQLASESPSQWMIRSVEEARRTGARVVESIRDDAEPCFRKYSDPDALLDALVNNEDEARWLAVEPFRRALTTVVLCASRRDGQHLSDVIAKMRRLVEKECGAFVHEFERFTDRLRSVQDRS